VDETWVGDNLFTFDGSVLELFGHPASPSSRWHVRAIELELDEERRELKLRATSKWSGKLQLSIPEGDWPAAAAFFERVLAGIPSEPPA
jgi:hypothetical protein